MSLYHLPLKCRMTLNFKVAPMGLCRSQPVLITKRMNNSYIYNIEFVSILFTYFYFVILETVSFL